MRRVDVAIVGGGPAGLALAIGAARRGLSTMVLEARGGPVDKACGEGILPAGVRALDALGVRARLGTDVASRIRSIRWIERDGVMLEGELPDGGGLTVRRTALSAALQERAREEGAVLRDGVRVLGHHRVRDAMVVRTDSKDEPLIEATVLVAADGLASPLRRAEGLDVPVVGPRRFGMRRHFALPPWSASVEVHLCEGVEAYVTPVGVSRVGVAFLFGERALGVGRISYDALLARFPALKARLAGFPAESRVLGAGPFARAARARARDRFALLGDAAGYVDAVTGEGLSLAFRAAASLAEVLPEVIRRDGEQAAFAPYERAARADFRKYAWITRAVLAATHATRLRPRLLRVLSRAPMGVDAVVAWATG